MEVGTEAINILSQEVLSVLSGVVLHGLLLRFIVLSIRLRVGIISHFNVGETFSFGQRVDDQVLD